MLSQKGGRGGKAGGLFLLSSICVSLESADKGRSPLRPLSPLVSGEPSESADQETGGTRPLDEIQMGALISALLPCEN